MNKKRLLQSIFVVLSVLLFITALSYASTMLFFKLYHIDLSLARPFAIWQYWQAYHAVPEKKLRLIVNSCAFGPYVILAVLTMILLLNKKRRSLHGDARFATLKEIKEAGLIEPKSLDKTILVGKYKKHYLTYGGYQFVMLAAPTRSGKGVGVVIPNCLNYSDSLVVLDIKLENFDITSGFRAAHGQEVYLFCPFDEKGRTHRYNPLEYISSDPTARIGDIDAIGTALYSGGNENDKFWSENAKDLFRGLCLLVLEHPSLPKTLGEILRQASGKGKPFAEHIQDMLDEAKKEGRAYSSACVDALNRIINNSENTLAGIVSTFNGPLLIFQNPRVDLATSANDFDLRDVRRKKMTIYLGVTPDKLKDAAVIVNLFFDQLLNLNTRVLPQQDKSLKYQCLLILDEFTAIGKVAMIQQSISYQAGYNMRVLTIIQNKSQLEDKYGKSGALTLMANHALMIMYAPSPVVQSDANEYSEMLGYETVKSKNKSRSFGKGGSRSESESDQRRALMLPQEIKELGRWREIVSLENCKPILCDKIKYFEDPAFTSRINWKTPEIPIQDVNVFVAKLEDKRRDLQAEDLDDPNLAKKVVGVDQLPDAPENLDDLQDEAYEDAVNAVCSEFVSQIVREPIDLEKYKLDSAEAAEISENMFGENSGDDEEAIEIEETQPVADVKEAQHDADTDEKQPETIAEETQAAAVSEEKQDDAEEEKQSDVELASMFSSLDEAIENSSVKTNKNVEGGDVDKENQSDLQDTINTFATFGFSPEDEVDAEDEKDGKNDETLKAFGLDD